MLRAAMITLLSIAIVTASNCGGGSGGGTVQSSGATVVVTPSTATVYQGTTVKFQAQVKGNSNQEVTWNVEQGGLGAIDSTGRYTAPRDASGGPFRVVATSRAVPSVAGSASVTVLAPVVSVTPASVTLAPGGRQTFTAAVKGLPDTEVVWSIQEPKGGSVDNMGSYTAPVATGFYHVIATSAMDTTLSASVVVTVTASSGRFTPTHDMTTPRGIHTATLLPGGRVLLAGGAATAPDPVCIAGITSAELYDSAAGSFTATGNMAALRYAHTATLLLNGKVLVVGGFASTNACWDAGEPAQLSAELYDPSTGSFQLTASMSTERGGHTATLLPNGKVLIAGGGNEGGGDLPFYGTPSNSAELYDPGKGIFNLTGSMAHARFGHTSTLLPNGKVLITGGVATDTSESTVSAELYDPSTGKFNPTGSMATARAGHTATLLPNGRVLIAGGATLTNGQFQASATAELYDPATGSFSSTSPMEAARVEHTATLLQNGTVLIAGGNDSTAEIYDPATGSFSTTGAMETSRSEHTATLLLNGTVLVTGGGSFLRSQTAEVYK